MRSGPASKSHTPHPITNYEGSYNAAEVEPVNELADDPLGTYTNAHTIPGTPNALDARLILILKCFTVILA